LSPTVAIFKDRHPALKALSSGSIRAWVVMQFT